MAEERAIDRIANRDLTPAQRVESVRAVMESNMDKIFGAIPKHVTPERLMRVALQSLRKTPKLLDCDPYSLLSAITQCANLGLEPDGVMGHAYLVPFGREVTVIPGYRGLIDLCRRSGNISTVSWEVVRKGDEFDYALGDKPYIHHVPSDKDDREQQMITHVYVVVGLRDGGIQRSIWTRGKIDAHKMRFSKGWERAERGKKDSPWHTDWEAMAKKTILRDMVKLLPVSAEVKRLAESESQYEIVNVESRPGQKISSLDSLALGMRGEEMDDRPPGDQQDDLDDDTESAFSAYLNDLGEAVTAGDEKAAFAVYVRYFGEDAKYAWTDEDDLRAAEAKDNAVAQIQAAGKSSKTKQKTIA